MSAGDPVIHGQIATPPNLYTEMPNSPRLHVDVDLEASRVGTFYVKLILDRSLRCLKKDMHSVIASMPVRDAVITAYAGVDLTGATQTCEFGGGWSLKNIETPPVNSTIAEINLRYEKSVLTTFEFDLPANVSVAFTGGKVQFKYKNVVLEEWDSKKLAKTTGITTALTKYGELVAVERHGLVQQSSGWDTGAFLDVEV